MLSIAALKFLTIGALFGLTAGISPGPLLTLVVTETLKHNKTEGIKIALAPLITDLPIILVTLLIFSRISKFNAVLGIISTIGGIYVAYLGYETIKTKGIDIEIQNLKSKSIKKGIIANFLNPHPYLFWLSIGAPIASNAFELSIIAVVLFFLSFYILLIGSKVGIALIADYSKAFLRTRSYLWIMRALGFALFIFSIFFLFDGIKLLLYA